MQGCTTIYRDAYSIHCSVFMFLYFCDIVASDFVSECEHGSVRLMGGSTSLDGRVEVCLGGQWGSVCADTWSVEAANVACGQLGYQSTGKWRIHILSKTVAAYFLLLHVQYSISIMPRNIHVQVPWQQLSFAEMLPH